MASLKPIPTWWDTDPSLDLPEIREAWERWRAHRAEIGKRLRPQGVSLQAKSLARWIAAGHSIAAVVDSIDLSIANGWQGLFEPRRQAGNVDFSGIVDFIRSEDGGP